MATLPGNIKPVAAAPAVGRRRRLLAGAVVMLVSLVVAGWQLWGWHHWQAGQQAMNRYDFPEALEHFESCLRVWPGPSVRLEAARAARRGNRYDQFEKLVNACETEATTAQTALERELVLAQQGTFNADVEQALQQLADSDHAEAVSILEALAKGYITSFRPGHAMVALEKLLKHAPDHKWAYFWRGNMHVDNEHVMDALADFRRAVELDPQIAEFRLRLAMTLVSLGKASDAWPYVAELLRQEPPPPDVLLVAARCQRDFGDRRQALEYLKRLLDEHSQHAEGWAERGRILGNEGEGAESLVCLRRAFQLEPRSYSIGFSLFNELTAQGHRAEAREIWNRIESSKRRDERVKKILEQLGKDGRNVALRHELATLFLSGGNESTAFRLFGSVLQIDPGYKPTHTALADYYRRQGNAEAAAFHQRQAGLSEP
jgi:Tfp pilus assembly protein PilF